MAATQVTIIYWRDVPAQVVAKAGDKTVRQPLSARFQEAIDRAAMRAGAESAAAYLADWRHGSPESSADGPAAAAEAVAARVENAYDDGRLRRLVQAGGRESG